MGNDVMTGVVKWFNTPKGCGFIINQQCEDVLAQHKPIMMEGYRRSSDGQTVGFKQVKSQRVGQTTKTKILEMSQ